MVLQSSYSTTVAFYTTVVGTNVIDLSSRDYADPTNKELAKCYVILWIVMVAQLVVRFSE